VTGDLPTEQRVFHPSTTANVVHNQITLCGFVPDIYDHADVRSAEPEIPGDDITWQKVVAALVQGYGNGLATGGRAGVKGISHGKEVATKTIVLGALMAPVFPIAPLALMQGFKRGENAVLPEGKRLLVFVSTEASVKVVPGR
jgi:hypothetical protein